MAVQRPHARVVGQEPTRDEHRGAAWNLGHAHCYVFRMKHPWLLKQLGAGPAGLGAGYCLTCIPVRVTHSLFAVHPPTSFPSCSASHLNATHATLSSVWFQTAQWWCHAVAGFSDCRQQSCPDFNHLYPCRPATMKSHNNTQWIQRQLHEQQLLKMLVFNGTILVLHTQYAFPLT